MTRRNRYSFQVVSTVAVSLAFPFADYTFGASTAFLSPQGGVLAEAERRQMDYLDSIPISEFLPCQKQVEGRLIQLETASHARIIVYSPLVFRLVTATLLDNTVIVRNNR